MNLHITGHHVQVTPSIREYISTKMDRITKHFDHVIDVNVIVSVAKLEQKIEATVHVRGRDIYCESKREDLYAAIDALIDKLDRTIIKHKEKSQSHRHDTPKRQPELIAEPAEAAVEEAVAEQPK